MFRQSFFLPFRSSRRLGRKRPDLLSHLFLKANPCLVIKDLAADLCDQLLDARARKRAQSFAKASGLLFNDQRGHGSDKCGKVINHLIEKGCRYPIYIDFGCCRQWQRWWILMKGKRCQGFFWRQVNRGVMVLVWGREIFFGSLPSGKKPKVKSLFGEVFLAQCEFIALGRGQILFACGRWVSVCFSIWFRSRRLLARHRRWCSCCGRPKSIGLWGMWL